MNQKEFKIKLQDSVELLDALMNLEGVRSCSALYAFILSARSDLNTALFHVDEYEEKGI